MRIGRGRIDRTGAAPGVSKAAHAPSGAAAARRDADAAGRHADRLRVMNAIYEAAEGSQASHVSGEWLLTHLDLPDAELGSICRYLEGEHLITAGREHWDHDTPFMILLTGTGAAEMERSRAAPEQATEHFPPIRVIRTAGDAIGSAVQVGHPRARRALSISDLSLDQVRKFVDEWDAQASSLDLHDGDAGELCAEIAAVKLQTALPTPDHYVIRERLQSAQTIIEHHTGSAAAARLLDLLRSLHL